MGLDVQLPDDHRLKIWRYLDLAKYASLLQQSSLYFCRADRLGDPFEGSITPGSIAEFASLAGEDHAKTFRVFTYRLREWSYVSCWHLSEGESAALWRLYTNSPWGIAIQTTVEKLTAVVPDDTVGHGFIQTHDVSVVHYIDYRDANPDMNSTVGPLICKRREFAHEREIRAVLQFIPKQEGTPISIAAIAGPPGRIVPLDVEGFVERVVVDPLAESWFTDLVGDLTTRYGVNVPVESSILTVEPFH